MGVYVGWGVVSGGGGEVSECVCVWMCVDVDVCVWMCVCGYVCGVCGCMWGWGWGDVWGWAWVCVSVCG